MKNHDIQFWDLITSKLHGELNPDEKPTFDEGMDDQQNQKIVHSAEKIHAGLKEARQLQDANKDHSWNRIEKQIRFKTRRIFAQNLLKYAAILVVAFVSGLYFHSLMTKPSGEIQYAEIEVMYGQTSHLFLFDGTEVWLNSGTKLRYPNQFNQNERNVFIEGEAFFKVAPNKNLPFKVRAGELEVEVLGTSFNVTAYKDEPDQSVVLVEGKVQINNTKGEKIAEILPGQVAVKSDGVPGLKIQHEDPYSYTSWKDGKVTFSGEKLSEIARKIERWYNVEIRFENENLKDYRFTGTILRNKPIDQTILAMEMLAPIRFKYAVKTHEKNIITIIKK
jgi:ferric-dicitrate binding protein FerR (iron transport regulator)